MKVKWFSKHSRLDEMQELTLRKIEARGFWIMWVGLVAAMAVQQIMGMPGEQMMGEVLVLLLGSGYTGLACIRNGIWDRRITPGFGSNLAGACVAGAVVFGLAYLQNRCWPGALLAGGLTFLLTLFVLQTMMHFYEKRHQELEHPKEEDDESEE